MYLTDESDLGSTESQPPSTSRRARHAFQDQIHDITTEVSAPPA